MTTTDVEGGGPLPEKKPVEEVAFLNGKNDQVRWWGEANRCCVTRTFYSFVCS